MRLRILRLRLHVVPLRVPLLRLRLVLAPFALAPCVVRLRLAACLSVCLAGWLAGWLARGHTNCQADVSRRRALTQRSDAQTMVTVLGT